MGVAVITGSSGLVGSEACRHFHRLGLDVWGVDNDLRRQFFGDEASTLWMRADLEGSLPRYRHFEIDIRDREAVERLFASGGDAIELVIHAAAQPSHDWAATDPHTDFSVNANGTLVLLEASRRHAPETVFVFCSTNKVYGDTPNRLPLVELERRYDLPEDHELYHGIPETMSIDASKHSLFGVSKAAADLMVQEYGRYFGLRTASFRGGCLTGPAHSGAELHGFLAYLMKCTATGRPYTVFGYRGKQVRDNIHSADLVAAFEQVLRRPGTAAVYNIGGGRSGSCSVLEAIDRCQEIAGRQLDWTYDQQHRAGDHLWWISDNRRFETDYPGWRREHDLDRILLEIFEANRKRWADAKAS
ncbi:MAG: NAD-dependent epimerase/dehydratase family protein [Thermoanaerobaculia bacterium]|nr:NAD-dependent epimerase/dehydratase family protein [Thermoanaerobaculia bacterium]